MHSPPEALEVGEYFSQEEIEESFNTGFGYRISGINPRRDSNDDRYILVFANEDGPYGDTLPHVPYYGSWVSDGLPGYLRSRAAFLTGRDVRGQPPPSPGAEIYSKIVG